MNLVLIVLLPFLGAVLPALMIRSSRTAAAVSAGSVTMLSLALLLTHIPAVSRNEVVQASWSWLPQAGLNASFFVDGLGLLFAAMILGIGLLVIVYARYYLSRKDAMGRFFAYLLLFQGAMVGVVLSSNVLLLLVFWELTSLSSFLLIGFSNTKPEGRQGARMALTVTAAGGLSLLAGLLLLGNVAGTFELTELLGRGDIVRQSNYYLPILLLILGGCFTKSAQFPFHFWLPHAMAAPTPVSAYLHSATMVKAGVFLMARLWPILSGTDEWFYIVATTGMVTMLFAAVVSLFRDDLKSILAYSTISHLGLMTMLLGFNTPMAVVACVFHIINHATFKAALFMNAGIVDHEVGSRDIRRLGGLSGLMPITATTGIIAAISMAGIAPLNGFLSKEMMLEEVSHTVWINNNWVFPILATIAATFSIAYSLRYIFFVYFGKRRDDYPQTPHDPRKGLWFPPALLVVFAVLIGLFPETWAGSVVRLASRSVLQTAVPKFYLSLWHGWTPALYMSLIALAVGCVVLLAYRPARWVWDRTAVIEAKRVFDTTMACAAQLAGNITAVLHNGSLQRSLFILTLTTALVGATVFFVSPYDFGTRSPLMLNAVMVVGWALVMGACVVMVLKHGSRLVALITVNVIGLMSSIAFIYLSAPDLALTQISVEVVTLILMLLALHFLPKESITESSKIIHLRDGLLAVAVGGGVGALCWAMMSHDFSTISKYYVEQSIPGGGGANVVNVILVDFRGFDTFGEIMVIGIAAMAIHAMLDGMCHGPLRRRLSEWTSGIRVSPNRHPLMMVVVTRMMLPLALMVSLFIFLRGHNLPGGGFIAALVVSIALIMQYMASGFGWADKQVRFDFHALIGGGALIAAATGIGSMVAGLPFLTSGHNHVHIPVLGDVELASAMAFDLGVFLTVVGGVMLALANFSNLGRMTGSGKINEEPMDYDPSLAPYDNEVRPSWDSPLADSSSSPRSDAQGGVS